MSKQMSRNGGGESTMKLEWPTSSLPDYVPGQIKDGSKMVVLLELICHSVHLGEKMLIFRYVMMAGQTISTVISKCYSMPSGLYVIYHMSLRAKVINHILPEVKACYNYFTAIW